MWTAQNLVWLLEIKDQWLLGWGGWLGDSAHGSLSSISTWHGHNLLLWVCLALGLLPHEVVEIPVLFLWEVIKEFGTASIHSWLIWFHGLWRISLVWSLVWRIILWWKILDFGEDLWLEWRKVLVNSLELSLNRFVVDVSLFSQFLKEVVSLLGEFLVDGEVNLLIDEDLALLGVVLLLSLLNLRLIVLWFWLILLSWWLVLHLGLVHDWHDWVGLSRSFVSEGNLGLYLWDFWLDDWLSDDGGLLFDDWLHHLGHWLLHLRNGHWLNLGLLEFGYIWLLDLDDFLNLGLDVVWHLDIL